MIEQVFIMSKRDGTFATQYLGVRSLDDFAYKTALADSERLADYEALLTKHGFTLADSSEELAQSRRTTRHHCQVCRYQRLRATAANH
jgi:predicted transcriptional regulator